MVFIHTFRCKIIIFFPPFNGWKKRPPDPPFPLFLWRGFPKQTFFIKKTLYIKIKEYLCK